MPYRSLYRRRQQESGVYLPKQWYVDDALNLQWVEGISLKATPALKHESLYGFIVKHNAGFLNGVMDNYTVVVADELPADAERFVVIKELMHCYFNPAERSGVEAATDSEIALEALLRHFFGKSAESPSAQVHAEHQAFWMAMGVICPERDRLDFRARHEREELPIEEIAGRLLMPRPVTELLLSDQYEDEIRHLIT